MFGPSLLIYPSTLFPYYEVILPDFDDLS